jgi:hypothetical protein
MTIHDYLIALLLTEIIEVTVAVLLGYRRRREIAAVILVNLVSHPILHYFLLLNRHFDLVAMSTYTILFLEAAVILVEWGLLVFALRKKTASLLFLSITMNLCSYLTGVLVYG